nr:hypothetical protein [Pandoravirus aubagnensis]
MELDDAPRHEIDAACATHGTPNDGASDGRVSSVIKLYAHLPSQSLDTLGLLVRALDMGEDVWMDGDGQALVPSDTASVLIVAPDNVRRCARLVAQQARNGERLRLSATGHWAGMISLFYESTNVDRQ